MDMGFWHTGYFEFHESWGIDFEIESVPDKFPCDYCKLVFPSLEDLRHHRLSEHPIKVPSFWISDIQQGSSVIKISRPLLAGDMSFTNVAKARLNDAELSLSDVSEKLSSITQGEHTVVLELGSHNVWQKFRLDIRIASLPDLQGVERQFDELACGRVLDTDSIEKFAKACNQYVTAKDYCDGLYRYLHGVLAKEGLVRDDVHYHHYTESFNLAAAALSSYDRPLARTARALVAFNFNQFEECLKISLPGCLQTAAHYFMMLANGRIDTRQSARGASKSSPLNSLEDLLTDAVTKQIIELAGSYDIARMAEGATPPPETTAGIPQYDHEKLRALRSEYLLAHSDHQGALGQSRHLTNMPRWSTWAESIQHHVKTALENSS